MGSGERHTMVADNPTEEEVEQEAADATAEEARELLEEFGLRDARRKDDDDDDDDDEKDDVDAEEWEDHIVSTIEQGSDHVNPGRYVYFIRYEVDGDDNDIGKITSSYGAEVKLNGNVSIVGTIIYDK